MSAPGGVIFNSAARLGPVEKRILLPREAEAVRRNIAVGGPGGHGGVHLPFPVQANSARQQQRQQNHRAQPDGKLPFIVPRSGSYAV
ncbi:hypothetical protein SDC9_72779 [bioreactor metagenome]|uniref:Uncharacterized protein n=1 Tax=bioreactor metagenome TaxID=1076179 RepID=A0A644YE90_9ZZZZ